VPVTPGDIISELKADAIGSTDYGDFTTALVEQFGGIEGTVRYIHRVATDPDSPQHVKARIADIVVTAMERNQKLQLDALDVHSMSDDELKDALGLVLKGMDDSPADSNQ